MTMNMHQHEWVHIKHHNFKKIITKTWFELEGILILRRIVVITITYADNRIFTSQVHVQDILYTFEAHPTSRRSQHDQRERGDRVIKFKIISRHFHSFQKLIKGRNFTEPQKIRPTLPWWGWVGCKSIMDNERI